MSREVWALATTGLAAILLAGAARAQPQPPGREIDQKRLCLSCHEIAAKRVTHAPVTAGECSACHNPHVARYQALLRDRPGPLCARCHDGLARELEKKTRHRPVAEGRCAACHAPHGSDHRGLLVSASPELCLGCHPAAAAWKQRRVQHSPFAKGSCETCHDPHSSERPGLLKRGVAELCRSCHPAGAALRRSHGGQPVENAACGQCHEPHASDRKGLFREAVHAPFADGGCAKCHPGPGAANPFATVKPIDELCGSCHAKAVETARGAGFPHVSAGGGRCTSCHNPHTGEKGLLLKAQQSLCAGCHDPGGARSGGKGRRLTHQDFDCTTCHQAHGGSRPLLFVDDPAQTCGSCHSHQHGVVHPLGEKARDPRNGMPMDCGSCHGIHRSDGEKLLFEADLRMLCVGCHKEMVGR